MAELELTQVEADALIAVEKHRLDGNVWDFPGPGEKIVIPLASADKRESFMLDITRVRIKLTKVTYQSRARDSVVLLRLDIDGGLHRNPDGVEVPCPHIHLYRQGYGDKWAYPVPLAIYPDLGSFSASFNSFMQHCNVTQRPVLNWGLF